MLDKFQSTRFCTSFHSTTGMTAFEKTVSPRVAILGAQTFAENPVNENTFKMDDQFTNSVTRQIDRMTKQYEHGQGLLTKFKNEAQGLRNEIDGLITSLCDKLDGVRKTVGGEIRQDYLMMKRDIR